jgi:tRNA U54 and U55 pseudouridine synthase Pus10
LILRSGQDENHATLAGRQFVFDETGLINRERGRHLRLAGAAADDRP